MLKDRPTALPRGWRSGLAALTLMLLGHAVAHAQQRIRPAPAFNAERLSTLPTDEWITNGGTLANQRYSPLTLLTPDNVAGLKGKWRTGMSSGATPGNSGQAQILVYEGVLYVSNGDNDVFAIDVDTGATLWSYQGRPDPKAGNPFGRSNRGVGLGDGKVYIAMLDATLAALDQRTGEQLWRVAVAPWQEGYSITSAPLYYDGMVITGVSGGVMGRRGRVTAYDADDGTLLWVFYTIPGPGELGHETWPQDSNAWQHGGAPVWQTPAVDPELGLLYFSTGNPGPVMNGAVRPGDNLFDNSIVALEAKTGTYRWHFQQVHHDIWDYDATDRVGSYAVTLPLAPPVDNQPYFGGSLGQSTGAPDRGIFAALDVRTNRLAWRQQWAEHCYSGSVVTRGGLVFVGRSDGRLTALDKRTGEKLWES